MELYNKIMVKLWLVIAFLITGFITYKCLTDGWNKWGFNYVFAGLAFLFYFLRRYMLKRFYNTAEYLENKRREEQG